jgi:elongation factor Ts
MLEKIKDIRNLTGAGVVDIKKALEEAGGDKEKAIDILRKKGLEKAAKKGDREAKEGVVGVYVHSNEKLGAMIKLYCETDFVARNAEFKELAKDLAMHIVAMKPQCVYPQEVDNEEVAKQREVWIEQLKSEGKPEAILDKILQGKEDKLRKEAALMTQAFVKNPDVTVEELVKEKIAKIGENIQIGDFIRFEL